MCILVIPVTFSWHLNPPPHCSHGGCTGIRLAVYIGFKSQDQNFLLKTPLSWIPVDIYVRWLLFQIGVTPSMLFRCHLDSGWRFNFPQRLLLKFPLASSRWSYENVSLSEAAWQTDTSITCNVMTVGSRLQMRAWMCESRSHMCIFVWLRQCSDQSNCIYESVNVFPCFCRCLCVPTCFYLCLYVSVITNHWKHAWAYSVFTRPSLSDKWKRLLSEWQIANRLSCLLNGNLEQFVISYCNGQSHLLDMRFILYISNSFCQLCFEKKHRGWMGRIQSLDLWHQKPEIYHVVTFMLIKGRKKLWTLKKTSTSRYYRKRNKKKCCLETIWDLIRKGFLEKR